MLLDPVILRAFTFLLLGGTVASGFFFYCEKLSETEEANRLVVDTALEQS